MKKFQFSLQKVLDIREKEEDLKKQVFGQCRREYLDSQDVLSGMVGEREECMNKAQILPGQRIQLEEREFFNHYLGVLHHRIERQREDVGTREERMEEARDDWVNKRREKMILERLKERKERIHTKEVLLKEQSLIDEIASIYVGMDKR